MTSLVDPYCGCACYLNDALKEVSDEEKEES